MTARPPRPPRPRDWQQLRRRVLEQDYLSLSDLEKRRRMATGLKWGGLLGPLAVAGVAADFAVDGNVGWPILVAGTLFAYAGAATYHLGRRWSRRWASLIAEKTGANGGQIP